MLPAPGKNSNMKYRQLYIRLWASCFDFCCETRRLQARICLLASIRSTANLAWVSEIGFCCSFLELFRFFISSTFSVCQMLGRRMSGETETVFFPDLFCLEKLSYCKGRRRFRSQTLQYKGENKSRSYTSYFYLYGNI